jgi:hypothetical protein
MCDDSPIPNTGRAFLNGEVLIAKTGRQKMITKWLVAVVITLSGLTSQGQDLKAITQHYKPNDTLRYRVEFEGDPKLDSVSVGFYLQGNVAADQPGLQGYFANRTHDEGEVRCVRCGRCHSFERNYRNV